ncbi:MAG: hypothetical protein LBP74_00785 [Treponema sp.]|nr:hypothetical protein [Treponema sp.]
MFNAAAAASGACPGANPGSEEGDPPCPGSPSRAASAAGNPRTACYQGHFGTD